ncbi:MAG: amidohydrolase/deacetylase family metallohydrolase [Acidobacteria bacterium]|jgi:dihydroorotase|nr:amidohydrolase/deacetylase family metallohydrolase [Acidobacteriota bacterium]
MLTRRQLAAGAAASVSLAQPPDRPWDLLIRHGEVRDPARGFAARADIALRDGKIAAIAPGLEPRQAREVINATGLYVVPGLVDLHSHIFFGGGSVPSIDADTVAARSGVTTWVDAGSFAHDNAPGFRRYVVDRSQVRVFGFVYLYPANRDPTADPIRHARASMAPTAAVIANHPDSLLGVKVQIGSNMNGRFSPEFLRIARELCDEHKLKLMVHISDAPPEVPEILSHLRAGDILTHAYTGHGTSLCDPAGKLQPGVAEARARGVVFDLGHGLGSFSFAEARKCLAAGFPVDTISSDLYARNIEGPVYDMPTTMTKLLHLGMPFDEVLQRSTINPARIIGRLPGMGTLAPGAPADLALLSLEDGEFRLVDSLRQAETAKRRIFCRLTICRGRRLLAPL